MKMTLCLALVLAFLSLQAANGAFLPTTQQPSQEQQQQQQQEPVATFVGHQVLRFSISTESERNQLIDAVRRLGLDLWAEHPEWMDVQVPPALLPEIQGLGLRHRVLIEDVQTRINLERFSIKVQPTNQTSPRPKYEEKMMEKKRKDDQMQVKTWKKILDLLISFFGGGGRPKRQPARPSSTPSARWTSSTPFWARWSRSTPSWPPSL